MEDIIGGDFEFDENAAEAASDTSQASTAEVEDAPVVRFLHKMLMDAFSMRASDLHFEPYEHSYRVRFRIDGQLREIASPPVAIKDKAGVADQGDLSDGHFREAGSSGRAHEAQSRPGPGHRLPRQYATHAVRRENRDPYSGPEHGQIGD